MSQPGRVGSENKLQQQKKGPRNLGERMAEVTHLVGEGEETRERRRCVLVRERKSECWILLPGGFKGWEFRGGLRGKPQENIHRLC